MKQSPNKNILSLGEKKKYIYIYIYKMAIRDALGHS